MHDHNARCTLNLLPNPTEHSSWVGEGGAQGVRGAIYNSTPSPQHQKTILNNSTIVDKLA